jgi:hypothetical protein
MEERQIYLTTKRLLYNMARVDFEYGRVTEDFVNQRKQDWEIEFNLPDYEKRFGPKKYE